MPATSNSGLTLTRSANQTPPKYSLDEEAFIVAGYPALVWPANAVNPDEPTEYVPRPPPPVTT